jgi:dolichol kinase
MNFHTPLEVLVGGFLGVIIACWFYDLKIKEINLRELSRQAVHFTGVLAVPFAYVFGPYLIGLISVLIAFIAYQVPRSSYARYFKRFTRKNEKVFVNALLLLLSISVLFVLFPFEVAVAGVLAVTVGDSMSTLYGVHVGRIKLWGGKSVEGSLACFVFTYVCVLAFVGSEIALPAAVLATLIESIPRVNDNFAVPMGVGLGLVLLGF